MDILCFNAVIMARTKSKNKPKVVQISISLPKDLVEAIDKMAEADNRNRSNFITKVLSDLAKKILG